MVYVPSAFSVSDTEPEVSFLLGFICKHACVHTHVHVYMCVCARIFFSLHVVYNVIFSLQNACDSFDGSVKVF
jgi:hypothetical protein